MIMNVYVVNWEGVSTTIYSSLEKAINKTFNQGDVIKINGSLFDITEGNTKQLYDKAKKAIRSGSTVYFFNSGQVDYSYKIDKQEVI